MSQNDSERYRKRAHDFITALSSGRIDLREWMTDDVDYIVVDADHPDTTAAIPWVGLHKGIAGVEAFLEQFSRNIEVHALPIDQVVADGSEVVVLGRFEFTAASTKLPIAGPWAAHLSFDGDKISRYHFYENTFAVARGFRTGQPWSVDNEGGTRQLAA